MTGTSFRQYDPNNPKRAATVKDESWNRHKSFILDLHNKRFTRAQMIERLRTERGFSPSMAQLVARLKIWGCTVNDKHYISPQTSNECSEPLNETEENDNKTRLDIGYSTDYNNQLDQEFRDWIDLLNPHIRSYPSPSPSVDIRQPTPIDVPQAVLEDVFKPSRPESILSQALMVADKALWFDNNGQAQRAIEHYTVSCRVLEDLVQKFPDVGGYEAIAAIPVSSVITMMRERMKRYQFSFQVQIPIPIEDLRSIAKSVGLDLPLTDSRSEELPDAISLRFLENGKDTRLNPEQQIVPSNMFELPSWSEQHRNQSTSHIQQSQSQNHTIHQPTPNAQLSSPFLPTLGSRTMQNCASISSGRPSLRSLLKLAMRIRKGKDGSRVSLDSMSIKSSSTSSFHQITGYDKMSIDQVSQ